MKMTAENVNLWYGDFHALKGVSLNMEVNQVTALIGPSGLRKVHLSQDPQPHERPGGGHAASTGSDLPGRTRIFTPKVYDVTHPAQARGHGLSKAQSVPHEHL